VTPIEVTHSLVEGCPLRFEQNHLEAEFGFPPSPNPDPRPPVPQPPEPRLPPDRKDPTLPPPDPDPDFPPGFPEPERACLRHPITDFASKLRFSTFARPSVLVPLRLLANLNRFLQRQVTPDGSLATSS
jgi:hypothetical protein